MKHIVLALNLILFSLTTQAQYCTPIGNCVFNDYIDDFQFNTINRSNSAGSNCGSRFNPGTGYIKTNINTTVEKGKKYYMHITSSTQPNRAQGFGIWIDLNGDSDFDDADEFVWSSARADTAFTDSILIPYSASVGLTVMRVRSIRGTTLSAGQPCSVINRGESEDYLVDIRPSTVPPLTDFKANATFTCNGTVQFEDITPNQVTTRLWEFGDGNTSTLPNPTHTYSNAGTYTVKLTCTNSFGSKATTKTNYITYTAGGPKSASCTPTTSSTASGFGITSFSFTTINNATQDGTVGFEDLSCIKGAVVQGNTYQMTIGSPLAPANQDFRAWIDYNNDGQFSNSTEMVLSENGTKVASNNVKIPANVVLSTPLRIRIAAVYSLSAPNGNAFTACANLTNGQMEDYAIEITPNNSAPVAEFDANEIKSCDGKVQFNDLSQNVPTSWTWDFGDGKQSNSQHPLHTYTSSGTYKVELTVSNLFGSDNEVKTAYITVNLADAVKTTCNPSTTSHREDYGIHSVLFESINNQTPDGSVGYEDYSCTHQVTVDENKSYSIEVKTGTKNLEDVYIWIDYNNDGQFSGTTEQVFYSGSKNLHTGSISIPSSSVKYKPLRMRVYSDIIGTKPTSCTDPVYGQAEDYAIIIQGDTSNQPTAPVAAFIADSTQSCMGKIQFTDQSTNGATNWLWDFGDGNTSMQQSPSHQYTKAGKYTVKLTASNSIGNDVETKTAYIDVDEIYCTGKVGFADLDQYNHFQIVPNPAEDQVKVIFPPSNIGNFELRVYTIQGQILYLEQIENNNIGFSDIDISTYTSGIHFVEVKNERYTSTKKLIVK